VRQREFARAIGRAVARPAVVPAPGVALHALLGEAASVLTASQRVVPTVLQQTGFVHRYTDLDKALRNVVGAPSLELRRVRREDVPDADYTRARRPRYRLVTRTELAAPLDRVFPFFASAANLQLLTPPAMAFAIETPQPIEMAANATIDYRLKILGIPARWQTVIERWRSPRGDALDASFVDAQHRGPYRAWWHEHHFHARGDHTVMEDIIYYAPPLGVLGAIANWLVVANQLRRIFGYRAAMIRQRFGAV
jgi:ligand-binding SRPBCC domain-containing protein